jgi:hypothetical protein
MQLMICTHRQILLGCLVGKYWDSGNEVHMKEQRNTCRSLLIRTKVMASLGKKKDGS